MRAVPAGELILVPDGLGLPEAAALLHDGSTAVGLLEETGVKPGEHMLVTAAAGGMGVLLVQLALAAAALAASADGRIRPVIGQEYPLAAAAAAHAALKSRTAVAKTLLRP